MRKSSKESGLCLLPANEDISLVLASVLQQHGVRFERHHNLFGLTTAGEQSRVVALLRQVLSEPERQAIRVLRDYGEQNCPQAPTVDEWWRVDQTAWFDEALEGDRFETWFQPIVDTCARPGGNSTDPQGFSYTVLAHECLIRLNAGRLYSGAEIVDAAKVRNDLHAFDSHARRLSIHSAARQSPLGKYFVNFMPTSLYNPELCMKSTMAALDDSGMSPENIVFEVVESDHVHDPAHLRRICDYFRRRGFEFALDDMGTGSGSLQMMCDLRPDYIKLDRSLARNVEQPMYAAAIGKLVELAWQCGTVVIAEGVEREETMENLWLLGVQWMQGYLFGRPAPRIRNGSASVRARYLPFPVVDTASGALISV